MASFGEKVDTFMGQSSMKLVAFIQGNFHTTEKNAIVLVGICIGVFLSLCLLGCVVVASNVCGSLDKIHVGSPRACCDSGVNKDSSAQEAASTAEGGEAGDEDLEAPSVANTEGAYRSDSDSDDEGQGARLSKQAQKRARSMAGV